MPTTPSWESTPPEVGTFRSPAGLRQLSFAASTGSVFLNHRSVSMQWHKDGRFDIRRNVEQSLTVIVQRIRLKSK